VSAARIAELIDHFIKTANRDTTVPLPPEEAQRLRAYDRELAKLLTDAGIPLPSRLPPERLGAHVQLFGSGMPYHDYFRGDGSRVMIPFAYPEWEGELLLIHDRVTAGQPVSPPAVGASARPPAADQADDDEELQPVPRRLLRYMKGRKAAELGDDLCQHVWHELAENVTARAVTGAVHKVNEYLRKKQARRVLSKVHGEPTLRWG
jgi:hypothetical protein